MKKKFSLLLVLAFVLTILPMNMLSVSAATVSPAYLVADFEDGVVGNNDGNTFSLVDGPGASNYAVKVTNGSKVPTFDFCLLGSLSGATEYVNGTKVTSKRVYDVSAWIRADAAVASDKVDFVFTMDSGATTYTHTVSDAGLVNGEWVKVETTIEYDGSHTASIGTVKVVVAGGIAYTMDDLTLMCRRYKPGQWQSVNPMYASSLGSQTSIGTSAATAVNGWYSIGGNTTMTTAYTGTEVTLNNTSTEKISGRTASITGTAKSAQIVCKSINLKYGTTYSVYFLAKADNDIAKTGKLCLIFSRSNRDDTENLSGNFLYVYPQSVYPVSDDLNLTSEWRRYQATFTYKDRTYNTVLPNVSLNVRNDDTSYVDDNPSFSVANFRIYQTTGTEHTNLYPAGSMDVIDGGNNCYSIAGSSSTTQGEVTNTITRVMAPYNGDHVIVKSMDAWENTFAFNLQTDTPLDVNGFKTVINAKDKDNYFGVEATRENDVIAPSVTAIAEFDQTVWAYDMPKLTAKVKYNAPEGNETLLALCAMYDANNKMVGSDIQEFTLTKGEGEKALSMDVVAEAVSAKVFLWEAGTYAPRKDGVAEIKKNNDAIFVYVDPVKGEFMDNTITGYDFPVKTLDEALDVAKYWLKTWNYDTYIVMMPGEYNITSQIAIDESFTSSTAKLVITSYDKNDKAVLTGGTDLTGKFTKYQGNIWRAPVPVGTQSRQLYVDGVKATVARSRDLEASEFVNTSVFNEASLVTLGDLETSHSEHVAKLKEINQNGRIDDVEFVFFSLWTNPRCQSASMTDNGDGSITLTMDAGWKYLCNKGNSHAYTPKYYENALELLDEGNEWYLDSEGGYVYYWPRNGVNIGGNAKVTLATYDAYQQPFMTITGTESTSVQNITFDNLVFADVTWTRPSTTSGHSDAQNNHIRENGDKLVEGVIDVKYAKNIHFTNNEFTRLGTTALRLLDGTKSTTVIGNEFYDLSSGAMNVGDPGTGTNYRYPTEANKLEYIKVENNYIHDVARDHWSAAAISAGNPANTNFSHNEICNIPYSAFHIGYGWDSGIQSTENADGTVTKWITPTCAVNLDITDNYIHDLFQGTIYDGGAIYTNGISGGTAENRSLITRNYITDIGPGAAFLYNDQGSTYYEVSHNVCDNSNIWGEYDVTTGKWKGPSGWMNVNLSASNFSHGLLWHTNYAIKTKYYVGGLAAADSSNRFDTAIFTDPVTGEWCDEAKAIIANAGIEAEYLDNFESGLQKVNVIKELNMNAGETFSNIPRYTTSKRETYKSNELTYLATSSDTSVASISNGVITAKSAGTATITYTVIENGVMYKGKTKVIVE